MNKGSQGRYVGKNDRRKRGIKKAKEGCKEGKKEGRRKERDVQIICFRNVLLGNEVSMN